MAETGPGGADQIRGDETVTSTATTTFQSPIGWMIGKLVGVFRADRLPFTLFPSVLLGAALTILPTALLYFGNRHAIASPGPFIEVVAGAALVAGVLVLLLSLRLAPHVSAGIVGASGYVFFSMSWVPGWDPVASLLIIWAAVSIIASMIAIWLMSNSRLVVTIAGTVAAIAAVTLMTVAIVDQSGTSAPEEARAVPEALAFSDTPNNTPNVYLFVLDGFANPDVTAAQFAEHGIDFDLDESIADLESLGFARDENATSNYGQTIFSLPSTMNAEYQYTEDGNDPFPELVNSLRGNNALVHSLRDIGYEYWFSSSGLWNPSNCDLRLADRCIGTEAKNSESTRAIWIASPIRSILASPSLDQLPDPGSVVDDILTEAAQRETDAPYFAFAHIVSPHQPYRYEADCSLREEGEPGTTLSYGFYPELRPHYVDQARCLGENLVQAMTELLEADPDGLIFIQADHGSEFEADRETVDWSSAMARERLSIFRMTNLPEGCRSEDPAAQSMINTVPLIIACLRGEEPELIEPRYFYVNFGDHDEIAEAAPEAFDAIQNLAEE